MGTTKLKALTLLEIIIAVVILSLSIVGLLAGFSWIKTRNDITHRHLEAQDFSRDTLERLLVMGSKDFNDPALTVNVVGSPHSTEAFLVLPTCPDCGCVSDPTCGELRDNFAAVRSYNVESVAEGKKISVTTSWTETGTVAQETLYGLVIQ